MEFLNASSFFIVLYFSDFAFLFQAPLSWALLVPGIMQSSHGGYTFSSSTWRQKPLPSLAPLAAPQSRGDGHGVRRTQFLAWLVVGQQMYRIMPRAGAIIPAPEGWSPGRHTHVCRASF